MVLVLKNQPVYAGDAGSIPGSERSPGIGSGNPLQYSCLGNSMGRGAWRTTVHGFAKSWTRLSMRVLVFFHFHVFVYAALSLEKPLPPLQ